VAVCGVSRWRRSRPRSCVGLLQKVLWDSWWFSVVRDGVVQGWRLAQGELWVLFIYLFFRNITSLCGVYCSVPFALWLVSLHHRDSGGGCLAHSAPALRVTLEPGVRTWVDLCVVVVSAFELYPVLRISDGPKKENTKTALETLKLERENHCQACCSLSLTGGITNETMNRSFFPFLSILLQMLIQ